MPSGQTHRRTRFRERHPGLRFALLRLLVLGVVIYFAVHGLLH